MIHDQQKSNEASIRNKDKQEWNQLFQYNAVKQQENRVRREQYQKEAQEQIDKNNVNYINYLSQRRNNDQFDKEEYTLNKSLVGGMSPVKKGFVDEEFTKI